MIQFDTSLYSADAVLKAIEDYKDIASISCIKSHNKMICSIEHSEYDLDLTAHEFSNYVLGLTVSMNGGQHDIC